MYNNKNDDDKYSCKLQIDKCLSTTACERGRAYLAALTGEQSIVVTRYSVSTDWTTLLGLRPALQFRLQLLGYRQ